MSQNQAPWPGDKIPNVSRNALTQSERDQLQSFVVTPSTSPMQPPNQVGDQTLSHYGMNSTSTSITPQLTSTPSTYISAPPISNSQYSPSIPTPHGSTSMVPHQYTNYGFSNTVGLQNMAAPMNPTFAYNHQQNTHMMPNASTNQHSQWSSQQNDSSSGIFASQSQGITAAMGSEPIPQNQIVSTSQYTMFPGMGSPSRAIEDVAGPVTPTGHNGVSPDFGEGTSMSPHAGTHQNSRTSSGSTSNGHHRSSKSRDKAPFKWRPGMKERKIMDEMSPEEKKEASDWNYKYSEAKKAHTREQNRVSAQKSRQKKVELLEKTKTQVERLEEDNTRLQNHIVGLESAVQQLSNENMHLRSNNEILRQRVALLEQQIQVRNPHVALPALGNQNHTPTLAPGVSQAQNFMQAPTPVPRQNPTPTQNVLQNAPQAQVGLDYGLGSTQNAQTLANNGPIDPNLQSQQPQQPQQSQQPENITREQQDDFMVDWMQVSLGDFQNSDPNSRPWSPSNGGAQ